MKNRISPCKVSAASISLLFALTHNALAVELAPSPTNLAGNIITITAPDVESNADPYENYGNITIANGGKLSTFNQFDNFGDYNSNGIFTINAGGRLVNAATFTVDTGAELRNDGTIDNNQKRMTNSQTFYNGGVFNNNFNADLTAARTYLLNSNTMGNSGTMMNGSDFYNTDLAFFTNNGRWTNLAGSYSVNSGNFSNFGTIDNSGTFNHNPKYVNSGFASVDNYFAFNNLAGGVVNNKERWYNRTTGVINNAGVFNNDITNAFGIKNEGTINNLAGGTFNASTGIGNYGQITNAGRFVINAGVSVNGVTNNTTPDVSTYQQTAGVTVVNGNLAASLIDIQAGMLTGSGTLGGPVLLGAAASLNPGNSPGALTINGDLTSAGTLAIEIAGLAAGQYDVLNITGAALFTGGTLAFDFINGFNAAAGNSWDFLYAGSYSGQNNLSYAFNGLALGLKGTVSFAADHWNLSVASVPVPAAAWLLGSGLLGMMAVARRRAV